MNAVSERELYEDELEREIYRFNADIIVWGEELIDKRLIVYPKKLRDVIGYDNLRCNLEPCGVALIDADNDILKCVAATVDITTGNIYMTESTFNGSWKILKNSVDIGISLAGENEGSLIEKPEDILAFDNLQTPGKTLVFEQNVIKYKTKELTPEEKSRIGRKQSLLDNPKMLYFYEKGGRYYHDKDCPRVKRIVPECFEASEKIPAKEICPQCQRQIYIRKACYPNTKQIGICDKILQLHKVNLTNIRHFVMEAGLKFHATSMDELLVESAEDNWIVKGLRSGHLELWHNNYVMTGPEERYITKGFHKQKVECKTLTKTLWCIEDYSFSKHLESKKRKDASVAGAERQVYETAPGRRSCHIAVLGLFRKMLGELRKIFG